MTPYWDTTTELTIHEIQFVRVHQVLLNILIGKAGLFQTVPFIGQPVAAVLRQVEAIVDVSSTLYPRDCDSSCGILTDNSIDYCFWLDRHGRE